MRTFSSKAGALTNNAQKIMLFTEFNNDKFIKTCVKITKQLEKEFKKDNNIPKILSLKCIAFTKGVGEI